MASDCLYCKRVERVWLGLGAAFLSKWLRIGKKKSSGRDKPFGLTTPAGWRCGGLVCGHFCKRASCAPAIIVCMLFLGMSHLRVKFFSIRHNHLTV